MGVDKSNGRGEGTWRGIGEGWHGRREGEAQRGGRERDAQLHSREWTQRKGDDDAQRAEERVEGQKAEITEEKEQGKDGKGKQ